MRKRKWRDCGWEWSLEVRVPTPRTLTPAPARAELRTWHTTGMLHAPGPERSGAREGARGAVEKCCMNLRPPSPPIGLKRHCDAPCPDFCRGRGRKTLGPVRASISCPHPQAPDILLPLRSWLPAGEIAVERVLGGHGLLPRGSRTIPPVPGPAWRASGGVPNSLIKLVPVARHPFNSLHRVPVIAQSCPSVSQSRVKRATAMRS